MRRRWSSLLGVCLFRELSEGRERAWTVHGGRSTVHCDGDAERFGNLRLARAGTDGATSVRRDAAVALLADRDGQRDQLFGLLIQRARGVCGGVHLAVAVVDLGDRATQRAGRFTKLLLNGVAVAHDVMVSAAVPLGSGVGKTRTTGRYGLLTPRSRRRRRGRPHGRPSGGGDGSDSAHLMNAEARRP